MEPVAGGVALPDEERAAPVALVARGLAKIYRMGAV